MTTDKDEIYVVLQKKSYSIIIMIQWHGGFEVNRCHRLHYCCAVFVIAQTVLIFLPVFDRRQVRNLLIKDNR